ncbi:MAG: radical SAM protein [Marinilabiliales bacterium]|nr:MAG: radical SAM protein [Marinilabiliales bacterium]
MRYIPIHYDEPLFRHPSEANSVILQVTLGCSWNQCAFCEMYTSKKFAVKDESKLFSEINLAAESMPNARKIFLADGNAFVLSFGKLKRIVGHLHKSFKRIQRVSAYALPSDIAGKTDEELRALAESGLTLLYVGIESGDDEVLRLINKSETYNSTAEQLNRVHKAGIKTSVMILTGLGGRKYSKQHAIQSAKILNEIQPYYASTLVLSFPYGEDHYRKKFSGEYVHMKVTELLDELEIFIQHTNLDATIFRSDHASNYLILKGVLGKDKQRFLEEIARARNQPSVLREEWMRGL